jgi:thiopurine S-methyltransferase
MDPSFWLDRWRRNEIGFHQPDVNAYLQQHWARLHAEPGARVFVPMCGKSIDMMWLRMQGHPVVGVELAESALRDFFTQHQLQPRITRQPPFQRWDADKITLLCGDFFELAPEHLQAASIVFDRAALIALPPALRRRYVEHLTHLLPDASMLLITALYPQGEMPGPPFSVPAEEVRELYTPHCDVELIHEQDVLDQNPKFRERGLTQLTEQVYLLRRGR